MFFNFSKSRNINNQLVLVVIFVFPVLSACSSTSNEFIETITPPVFPKELASIPDNVDVPEFTPLLTGSELIEGMSVGRKDPFLPPEINGNELTIPASFKYKGHISTSKVVNAFVSFENRAGIIKPGDIGGKTTDLLPNGWRMFEIDINTKDLILKFEERLFNVELFKKANK